ncbi:MAG: LysM peptidoglycan-binding domain-containing protein [Dehalococcoidia bacterium]
MLFQLRPTPAGPRPGVLRRRIIAGLSAAALALAFLVPAFAHVVEPGETLSGIADEYGVPLAELASVNGLTNTDQIYVGQSLRIPGASNVGAATVAKQYVVGSGDTLFVIAQSFGVSLEALMAANGLTNPDALEVGTILTIPGAVTPTTGRGQTHTVAAGETLSGIADTYGVPLTALMDANSIRNGNAITVGQVLVVPGGRPGGAAGARHHVVVAGDSLSAIAGRYGVSIADLMALNGLADADQIYAGQSLALPAGSVSSPAAARTHTVVAGETLSHVADQYGVSILALEQTNSLRSADHVYVGQVLVIPGGGTAAAPRVATRTHLVRDGESLLDIAIRYGTSLDTLVEMNGLANPNLIRIGQELAVPGVVAPTNRTDYAEILVSAAAEFGVPADLVKAVAWQESGWNQSMVSHAGAIGLMQVMPGTAGWALEQLVPDATDWDIDARANARMGSAILRHWLIESEWDIELTLAAYYQGWHSVHTIGFYDDTHDYIASIMAIMAGY